MKTFTMQTNIKSLFNDFSGSKEEGKRNLHFIFDGNRKVIDDVGYEELADAHDALANLIESRRKEKGPLIIRTFVLPKNIHDRFYQVATYYIRTDEDGAHKAVDKKKIDSLSDLANIFKEYKTLYLEFSEYSNVLIGRDSVEEYIKDKTEESKHRIVCRTKEIKIWMYAGGLKFCT